MKSKQQNILISIVVIAVLIIVAAVSVHNYNKNKVQKPRASSPVTVSQLTPVQLTGALPPNFPTEIGSKVIHSSQLNNAVTKQTTTIRTTTTAKTLAAAFALYQAFFAQNNWAISTTTDQSNLKIISASKGGQQINILIAYNAAVKSNMVVASLIQ